MVYKAKPIAIFAIPAIVCVQGIQHSRQCGVFVIWASQLTAEAIFLAAPAAKKGGRHEVGKMRLKFETCAVAQMAASSNIHIGIII